jgi:hypothetical protein
MTQEGGPIGVGNYGLISTYRELQWPKITVVSGAETP